MKPKIGYCTNVHAGTDLQTAKSNLLRFACRARELANWDGPLGVGLWLAEEAAQQTLHGSELTSLSHWLAENNLEAFTMNGFPQGNFHDTVVKHRVYQPEWWEPSRLSYTLNLTQILAGILPEGATGSISTLPIAWGKPKVADELLKQSAEHLARLARELHQLFETRGREIVIAIEPEPGCSIGDASGMRTFFQRYLLSRPDAEIIRKYITICHDVCHSAVMREDQGRELRSYANLGLRVGKVQVSSAVLVNWDLLQKDQRVEAMTQLRGFAEDRYLHQTTVQSGPAGSVRLHEDLPALIDSVEAPSELSGSWCVHFHVPIYLPEFGLLQSTQPEIDRCLQFFADPKNQEIGFTNHWEVETYAWGVLPSSIAKPDLANGIAEELRWFRAKLEGQMKLEGQLMIDSAKTTET